MPQVQDLYNYENIIFILSVQAIADDTLARIHHFDRFEALSVSELRAHVPLEILSFYLKQVTDTKALIQLLIQKHPTVPLQALIGLHWEGDNEVMCAWIKAIITAIDASNKPTSHRSKAA